MSEVVLGATERSQRSVRVADLEEALAREAAKKAGIRCYVPLWIREALVAFAVMAAYLGIGITFYTQVEEKPCEEGGFSRRRLEDACTEPWTWIDALYFSMARPPRHAGDVPPAPHPTPARPPIPGIERAGDHVDRRLR